MEIVVWLIVIGSAIWVGADAAANGVRRGCLGGGFFDMGPAGWFFVTLLFWIVGFPAYLAHRGRYRALRKSREANEKQRTTPMIDTAEIDCPRCGAVLQPGQAFCGRCGNDCRATGTGG